MQVTQVQLKRQQEILKALGFYHGKIDGIWGPKSIEAKKKFEADPSFVPGIPNNGMPFASKGPYPAFVTLDHKVDLLSHPSLSQSRQEPEDEDDDGADDASFALPG